MPTPRNARTVARAELARGHSVWALANRFGAIKLSGYSSPVTQRFTITAERSRQTQTRPSALTTPSATRAPTADGRSDQRVESMDRCVSAFARENPICEACGAEARVRVTPRPRWFVGSIRAHKRTRWRGLMCAYDRALASLRTCPCIGHRRPCASSRTRFPARPAFVDHPWDTSGDRRAPWSINMALHARTSRCVRASACIRGARPCGRSHPLRISKKRLGLLYTPLCVCVCSRHDNA